MNNQDKIFDKFKEAAENVAPKDFPGMEQVWSRVEQKLDKKEDKKTIALWKKIAVAASLLLIISLGSQFLKSDKMVATETEKVVLQETEKEKSTQPVLDQKNSVPSAESGIVSDEEAVKILDNHTKNKESVAIQEPALNMQTESYAPVSAEIAAPVEPAKDEPVEEESDKILSKKEVSPQMGYSGYPERESAKVAYAASASQKAKKSSPLVVLNGNAMAHSDDVKRDKMMQAELSNVQPENVDSLVILDEPLYIIDGIYYSENDLFGKNPTSPYAPLNEQEIKTITILQDLEATSKYGEKGKKGVVIITTKTGKPALKK
ncbi:hypothetical protein [Flavobacterium sp. N2038]|uniref:hypothetical protein n=1 Tax=Flavobacterium sp. N2038 TaxID=2986829 RepID=UPI0022253EF1|nr:hypothetical protein [Flavobacterium sp. N2038]